MLIPLVVTDVIDAPPSELILFTRPGCHLCGDARQILDRLISEGFHFDLSEVNIESDEDLHLRYLERIPVLRIDGSDELELNFGIDEVRARLVHGNATSSSDSDA